jgi:GT2 family glycosyltransferase
MQKMAIVILSFNHPLHTARAVKSALKWDLPTLLVHNGSLPQHVEFLQDSFRDSTLLEHHILPQNRGYSGGVNEGLKRSFEKREWALFLTNDCEVLNLPQPPEVPGAGIPKIFRRSLHQVDSVGGLFHPSKGYLRHCKEKSEFIKAHPRYTRYIPGSSFLVHREAFHKTQGMNEELGTYWDDVDWSVRLQRHGYQLELHDDWHMLHHVGKTCQKKPLYSIYYFQRNRKKISWKYSSRLEKPKLMASLARDWLRLGYRLVAKKRFQDLKHLGRVVLDEDSAVPTIFSKSFTSLGQLWVRFSCPVSVTKILSSIRTPSPRK